MLPFVLCIVLAASVCGTEASLRGTAAAKTLVTPVQKVVELLGRLRIKVEDQGKTEAKQYDKYACFCKEEADGKLYATEKSQKMIDLLTAKIAEISSELEKLNTDIGNLKSQIVTAKGTITQDTGTREGERDAYSTQDADLVGAIDAIQRAIVTLKGSKNDMEGKTELEALVQLVTGSLSRSNVAATNEQWSDLQSLGRAGQPGEAYKYSYHSNTIIETLESLLATFKGKKQQFDEEEFATNSAFEKKRLSLQNEIKFAQMEEDRMTALTELKTEEVHGTRQKKDQEVKMKAADDEYMSVLTGDCQEKATFWDQRSTARAQELAALADAVKALETGVVPNYKANKKLVGLVSRRTASTGGHWVWTDDLATEPAPKSFMQLGSAHHTVSGAELIMQRAVRLLTVAADRLESSTLSTAVLKIKASDDHFVKVRALIKDLISKLEQTRTDEEKAKTFCDTSMAEATSSRDVAKTELESLQAQIEGKTARKSQVKDEIAQLSAAIAANVKAVSEATELRTDEKKTNDDTVAEAGAGKEAVEQALLILRTFYQSETNPTPAFLQKSSYVPAMSDRDGETLADKAPEIFKEDYKGNQEASKGIIGLLEVILADFDRTGTTVTAEDGLSQDTYDGFKTVTDQDTAAKQGLLDTNNDEITSITNLLVDLEGDEKDQSDAHELALSKLDKLRAMCVEGEETYEGRVAQRQKEIESLKEALKILREWQD